jgi:hypothetical protein
MSDQETSEIVYVRIDEWKRIYGEPGLHTDPHGRIGNTFQTEPCFCEEALQKDDARVVAARRTRCTLIQGEQDAPCT